MAYTIRSCQTMIAQVKDLIAFREETIKDQKGSYEKLMKEWEKLQDEKERVTDSYREKCATYMNMARKEQVKQEYTSKMNRIQKDQAKLTPTLASLKTFMQPHEDAIHAMTNNLRELESVITSSEEMLERQKEWTKPGGGCDTMYITGPAQFYH